MKEKITVHSLEISITRRCNLSCEHCLRGDAQNIDIKNDYIEKLFSFVGEVHTLFVTGGEPSLNIPAFQYIIDSAIRNRVVIDHVNITTNGFTDNLKVFFELIERLQSYCVHPEHSVVSMSVDKYHKSFEESLYQSAFISKNYYKKIGANVVGNTPRKLGRAYNNGFGVDVLHNVCLPVAVMVKTLYLLSLDEKGYLSAADNCTWVEYDAIKPICHVSDIHSIDELFNYVQAWNDRKEVKTIGTAIFIGETLQNGLSRDDFCSWFYNGVKVLNTVFQSPEFKAYPKDIQDKCYRWSNWDYYKCSVRDDLPDYTIHNYRPWWECCKHEKSILNRVRNAKKTYIHDIVYGVRDTEHR